MSDDGLSAVEDALDDVGTPESPDEIGPEDMARLRESLPDDPETAKLVNKALPYPWSDVFEYVSPSERQSGYWRVVPDRSEPRSEADAEAREQFAELAQETTGVEGVVERDGQRLPPAAAYVAAKFEGERFSMTGAKIQGKKAFERLRDVLGR